MKNAGFAVFKKELARFFGDRRLVFSTVILPGLMIFLMYSLMGTAFESMVDVDDTYAYNVAVTNMPQELEKLFTSDEIKFTETEASSLEDCKERLSDKSLDLYVVFPENFSEAIANFKSSTAVENVANVEIYYNSTNVTSGYAYDLFDSRLEAFETSMSNVFDINRITSEKDANKYDVATEAETSGTFLAAILPMIIMIFLYSGCVALAPESIAGEKERGTIATLLITPIPRNQIAIGKIAALAILALLSGLSSFLGTFLSMPALMQTMGGGVSAQYYMFTDYLWLIMLIISTVLLFVTIIAIISAFAKTVKEASTFVMPLMIIVMVASFVSMYSTAAKEEAYWYIIPIYNSVQSMIGIFSFTASPVNLIISVLSNIAYSLLGVFALTKMFNSERIMFTK